MGLHMSSGQAVYETEKSHRYDRCPVKDLNVCRYQIPLYVNSAGLIEGVVETNRQHVPKRKKDGSLKVITDPRQWSKTEYWVISRIQYIPNPETGYLNPNNPGHNAMFYYAPFKEE